MSWQREQIIEAAQHLLQTVPLGVTIVAAAKQRTPTEVEAVIQAGITHIGHNYIQEAQRMIPMIGHQPTWHMIGHLQRNKASLACQYFDMVDSLDSIRLANTLEQTCTGLGKTLAVLIEINSGREINKTGIFPEDVLSFITSLPDYKYIRIDGLMTMGPVDDPQKLREAFRTTRQIFEEIKSLDLPRVNMMHLSMGMSDSYQIAIEEGSNMIRVGNIIFGSRNYC